MRTAALNRNRQDWIWFTAALLAFCIPIFKRAVPILLIIMAVMALVNYRKWNSHSKWIKIGFMGMFVLLAAGLFFTTWENMSVGMKELEVKASYFAIPLLFFVIPNVEQRWLRRILDSFTIGVFCFIIFSMIRASILYAETGRADVWTYYRLAKGFHPTYMAFYCAFAMGWLLMRFEKGAYVLKKWLHMVAIIILLIYITLLASKAGLITAFLTLGWAVGGRIVKWAGLKLSFPLVGGLMLLFIASSILSPASKRVGLALDNKEIQEQQPGATTEKKEAAISSSGLRMVVWRGSLEVLKDHPFGLGTGNVQEVLNDNYLSHGEIHAADQNLNSHNQFLQIALEHGIIPGLVLFLLVFGLLVYRWLKVIDTLGILMIGLLLVNFVFESFMERQEGIVFSIFFLCLLAQKEFTSYEFASAETS